MWRAVLHPGLQAGPHHARQLRRSQADGSAMLLPRLSPCYTVCHLAIPSQHRLQLRPRCEHPLPSRQRARLPAAEHRQQRRRLAGAAQALQAAPIARHQRADGLQLPAGGPKPLTRAAGAPAVVDWMAASPQLPAGLKTALIGLPTVAHRACTRRWVRACAGRAATAAFWVKVACILLRVAGWVVQVQRKRAGGQGDALAKIACLTCSLHEVRGSPGVPCKLPHCLQKLRDRFDGIQRRAPPLPRLPAARPPPPQTSLAAFSCFPRLCLYPCPLGLPHRIQC